MMVNAMTASRQIRTNPADLRKCLAAVLILSLAGCQTPQRRANEQATQRWNQARAQVKAKLARDQFVAGNVKAAAGELAEARLLDPANASWVPLQARIWLAQGNTAAAGELLDRTHLEGPPQAEVEYLRGVIFQQQQRWDEALAAFQRAAELDESEAAYVVAAVQVWLQLGRPRQALQCLQASKTNFAWTNAYQAALAECLEAVDDWAGAASAWQRVAEGAEADADTRERLAEALCHAGRYGEAVPVLQGLLTAEPARQSDGVRLRLAEALLAANQPEAARAQAQAVLQNHPEKVAALMLLAQAWALAGDSAAALRAVDRALQLDPQNARCLELAAALEWTAGNVHAARDRANRLDQLDPGNSIAACILRLIPATRPREDCQGLRAPAGQEPKSTSLHFPALSPPAKSPFAFRDRAGSPALSARPPSSSLNAIPAAG
jgi:tetratricopeptide (TPR) repeat protein